MTKPYMNDVKMNGTMEMGGGGGMTQRLFLKNDSIDQKCRNLSLSCT